MAAIRQAERSGPNSGVSGRHRPDWNYRGFAWDSAPLLTGRLARVREQCLRRYLEDPGHALQRRRRHHRAHAWWLQSRHHKCKCRHHRFHGLHRSAGYRREPDGQRKTSTSASSEPTGSRCSVPWVEAEVAAAVLGAAEPGRRSLRRSTLVFNRIGSLTSPPANGVHDTATVRLKNTGTGALTVSGFPISGPRQLVSPPGPSSHDRRWRYARHHRQVHRHVGTRLQRDTDDSVDRRIENRAALWYWQSGVSEGGKEPTLSEIAQVFGYSTVITHSGQQLNQQDSGGPSAMRCFRRTGRRYDEARLRSPARVLPRMFQHGYVQDGSSRVHDENKLLHHVRDGLPKPIATKVQ